MIEIAFWFIRISRSVAEIQAFKVSIEFDTIHWPTFFSLEKYYFFFQRTLSFFAWVWYRSVRDEVLRGEIRPKHKNEDIKRLKITTLFFTRPYQPKFVSGWIEKRFEGKSLPLPIESGYLWNYSGIKFFDFDRILTIDSKAWNRLEKYYL